MCGLKYVRLDEFVVEDRHGMAIELEPQGVIFAEIRFINPIVDRKPKLIRQKKMFIERSKFYLVFTTQKNVTRKLGR